MVSDECVVLMACGWPANRAGVDGRVWGSARTWPSSSMVVAIESEMTLSPTPPTWLITAPGATPSPVTAMPTWSKVGRWT